MSRKTKNWKASNNGNPFRGKNKAQRGRVSNGLATVNKGQGKTQPI